MVSEDKSRVDEELEDAGHIEQEMLYEKVEFHELEQRGLDLECTSCTTPHGHTRFFKPGEILWRDEDNQYRVKSVEEDRLLRMY